MSGPSLEGADGEEHAPIGEPPVSKTSDGEADEEAPVGGPGGEGSDEVAAGDGEGSAPEERQAKAPWHFKLIVVGSVVYLGYRLYQGITWLAHHI